MENTYKLTLYNGKLYKEIDLPPDIRQLTVGTYYDNSIRIPKDIFLEDFYISILQVENGKWELECSPNTYFYLGDIRKMLRVGLKHGDNLGLRYQTGEDDFLKIAFSIDFDNTERKFGDVISLDNIKELKIGSSAKDNIVLTDKYICGDELTFRWNGNQLILNVIATKYGVFLNGKKVEKKSNVYDCDFIAVADYQFYYKEKCLYTDINDHMRLNGITSREKKTASSFKYPKFNRNTREEILVPLEPIQILDPPERPEKPKNNLFLTILPALGMLVLTVVIRGFMSDNGSSSFVIFSACTIGMGIVTSIISFIQGKKDYKKSIQERELKYTQYIEEKCKQIEGFREEEKDILNIIYPALNEEIEKTETFASDLFDRTDTSLDFLDVRLGKGINKAQRIVNYKPKEKFVTDDTLSNLPEKVTDQYEKIADTPVVLKMKDTNAVGIVGKTSFINEFARNIVIDLVCRQYKEDLKLAFIMGENQKEEFQWARYLPHVKQNENYTRLIACDTNSRINLFEYLYKEFSNRLVLAEKSGEKEINACHIVLVILDDSNLKTHPIAKFIPAAAKIHVTFLFLENYREQLPLGISKIIYQKDGNAELVDVSDKNKRIDFEYEYISDETAERLARKLAPVYCEEINLEGSLVKSISLFEVLNINSVEDLDLTARWSKAQTFKSMAAPLGVKSKNEIVSLDIHEKVHGPHGLVAGTTGSGKSEILQSYILSMASLYHPYEVSFVIIDFKGGGMANQFLHLPHLIGAITNIDGKQINRSLLSIKAELVKRQKCFAEAQVNHIDNYILKYKAGEVEIPLPHLIIIVDEFAELKAEHPEFMKELISASRIGRSLGVHLILATQKPSGQVNEQIWSNSKFRLCLKVQNAEDSNEMIKSPLAAEILEPGRAYLQVGNNEIFELFQSGFSGAPENMSADTIFAREYHISEITFEGKRKCVFSQKVEGEKKSKKTQLEALIEYINGYCEEKNILKLPSICLPPLPEVINFPERAEADKGAECIVEIGILDDPNNQRQIPAVINFSQDNVITIGSSQYGKTNLLQLIIRGLCSKYTPDEVNIYILDFGSMVLHNFDSCKHVGGVVVTGQDEKFKNLMKLLLNEIETRKEKLMKAGVSSFISYREAGYTDLPQIVFLIDNYTAVREFYLQEEDPVLQITREGITVGISTVIANSQTAGMGYRYLSNFAKRIVFYCNESGEYSNVIDRCRIAPDNLAGRALTEIDKEVFEMQTYLSFEGEREIERVQNMQAFVEVCNDRNTGRAKRIPVIPEVLEMDTFIQEYVQEMKSTYIVPVGLYYDPISVLGIDLLQQGWFTITGKDGNGKRNLLHVIMEHLYRNQFECPVDVYIVDSLDRRLLEFENLGIVQEYTIDSADAVNFVEEIYEELENRYQETASGTMDLKEEPLKMVVIRNMEAIDAICKNATVLKEYKELIQKLKAMKVCFLFVDITNEAIGYSAPEILKNIKDSKNMFYFDDLNSFKITDVSVVTMRKFKKKITAGDAYWISGNEIQKVKIVKKGE